MFLCLGCLFQTICFASESANVLVKSSIYENLSFFFFLTEYSLNYLKFTRTIKIFEWPNFQENIKIVIHAMKTQIY